MCEALTSYQDWFCFEWGRGGREHVRIWWGNKGRITMLLLAPGTQVLAQTSWS